MHWPGAASPCARRRYTGGRHRPSRRGGRCGGPCFRDPATRVCSGSLAVAQDPSDGARARGYQPRGADAPQGAKEGEPQARPRSCVPTPQFRVTSAAPMEPLTARARIADQNTIGILTISSQLCHSARPRGGRGVSWRASQELRHRDVGDRVRCSCVGFLVGRRAHGGNAVLLQDYGDRRNIPRIKRGGRSRPSRGLGECQGQSLYRRAIRATRSATA